MTDGTTAPGGVLDERGVLQEYLHHARRSLVWKLDGLSERDARRPLTPTGTNLLGLVKHCAGTRYVAHLQQVADSFASPS